MRFPHAVMLAVLITVAVAICYWGVTNWEVDAPGTLSPRFISGPRQLGESLGVGALIGSLSGFLLYVITSLGSQKRLETSAK
jgi:hypothetical protein